MIVGLALDVLGGLKHYARWPQEQSVKETATPPSDPTHHEIPGKSLPCGCKVYLLNRNKGLPPMCDHPCHDTARFVMREFLEVNPCIDRGITWRNFPI